MSSAGVLFDNRDDHIGFAGLADGNPDFLHDAGSRRYDRHFHLHGFHDGDFVIFLYAIPDLYFDVYDFSHHGSGDFLTHNFLLVVFSSELLEGRKSRFFPEKGVIPRGRFADGMNI